MDRSGWQESRAGTAGTEYLTVILPDSDDVCSQSPAKNTCPEKEDIGNKVRGYCYWSATKSMALLVMATDFAGSFSIPVMARMQSIFSTTTSASWWIAWKR
jgi:hypothetical protein